MKPLSVAAIVGGLVLIAMGTVWTLQGLGFLPGSVMTGVTLWAVVGPLVAIAGGIIVARSLRRRP